MKLILGYWLVLQAMGIQAMRWPLYAGKTLVDRSWTDIDPCYMNVWPDP